MTSRTIITNAQVDDRLVSVHVERGHVVAIIESDVNSDIEPDIATRSEIGRSRHSDGGIAPEPMRADGSTIIDAGGGALLPGLHDHHVHLLAMAARRAGVDVDACMSPDEFDEALSCGLEDGGDDWIRVGGYDEHRHGPLDAARLDALAGRRKIRVQHRSGLAWVVSTAGLESVAHGEMPEGVERDADGVPTGWLLRLDAWFADRIGVMAPSMDGFGAELASVGITGVTDATPELGAGRIELLRSAVDDGSLPQRLVLLGVEAEELGGSTSGDSAWAEVGAAKLLLDEVRGIDIDAFAARIAAFHRTGRPVAIHAVSRVETVAAVMALDLAGPLRGDRIEHGSVLPRDLDPMIVNGEIAVIVQPHLVFERGDHYLDAVDTADRPFLHRARSLIDAGIAVAAGSDAPVTMIDPWAAIASASSRRTRTGVVLGPEEIVDPRVALDWYLADPLDPAGEPRRIRVGTRADLCLLDVPLDEMLSAPDSNHVRRTWVGGRLVHS